MRAFEIYATVETLSRYYYPLYAMRTVEVYAAGEAKIPYGFMTCRPHGRFLEFVETIIALDTLQ